MIKRYFDGLYRRAMRLAYERAHGEIAAAAGEGGPVLDCGACDGWTYDELAKRVGLRREQYHGLEWEAESARRGRENGFDILCADLNKGIPHDGGKFACVFAISVLEHLLNGCRFLQESHRVLRPGGTLVLVTPNISTYFTAALILAGRMPSSGPHPDSNALMRAEALFGGESPAPFDTESDTPRLRHLVVFSYKVLRDYLGQAGFEQVRGYGYGLYPFPNFMQPWLERLDPYHCHQMVFVARKPR